MKKGLILGVIIIIVLAIGIGGYFMFSKPNISKFDGSKLGAYTLEQKEVIEFISTDEVLNHQVAPKSILNQEIYNNIENFEPSCLENLNLGEEIRVVTYYIETHEISVIWSLKKNKIVCILASPND